MGGAPSTSQQPNIIGRSDEEIIKVVLPLYYNKEPIQPNEREAAVAAWRMIMNNTSAHFKNLKKAGGSDYPHQTCMELFYYTFYTRLFDVHPIAKTLFHRSINKQGTFFVRFISMAISQLDDQEKWTKSFTNLTEIHNKMGVKAIEYGVAGDVLLHGIQVCVGPLVYNELVHNGWTKIYSKMLDSIVPLALKFELDHRNLADAAATKRFKDNSKSSAMITKSHHQDPSGIFSQHQSAHQSFSAHDFDQKLPSAPLKEEKQRVAEAVQEEEEVRPPLKAMSSQRTEDS